MDTRAKIVTLTEAGKKIVRELVPIIEKIDCNFFGAISKQEQHELIYIFD